MIAAIKEQFKPISSIVLVILLAWFAVIVIGWFLMPFLIGYLKEVIAFGFLSAIFIGLSLLFPSKRNRYWFLIFSLIFLSVFAFIKLSFYINYGVKLSSSALFVIFETNGSEASDFLLNYFNSKVIGLLLFFVAILYISIRYLGTETIKTISVLKPIKVLGVVAILVSIFAITHRFTNENLVLSSILSYSDYTEAKANLKAVLAQENTSNITVTDVLEEPQTYVVVIGESTSSWHMQLYGYDRETNPLLTEIKDELLVFDSVITPNVHTIVALNKILTLSDFNEPNKEKNASIVQLANEAGFETFWISNQKPVGLHESIPSLIGNASNHKHFVTTDNSAYNIYDESLLPFLDKTLKNKAKKKLIFLHLIGNHTRYNKRYPEAYNKFTNAKENAKYSHEKAVEITNEYDNATLYNDYIIREIIERVRQENSNSYVLYFSDHGDEVYDTFDFVGHNEFHSTRPMHEVPFIVWCSDIYKQKHSELFTIEGLTNRAYMLDDFIHSFSDLSHISFNKFNAEKSIFNTEYHRKQRLIKKGEDYDKR